MVDVQTISIVMASASVMAGIVYYAFQIRHQNRMRETDLIMRLYSAYGNEEYSEVVNRYLASEYRDYDDFVKKYGPFPSEGSVQVAFRTIGMFYEGVGILLNRKLVNPDLVYDLFNVELFWEKMKPIAEGERKRLNYPNLWEYFEYLYNEWKKRERKPVQSKKG